MTMMTKLMLIVKPTFMRAKKKRSSVGTNCASDCISVDQLFCLPCKLDKFRNYQFDFAYLVKIRV